MTAYAINGQFYVSLLPSSALQKTSYRSIAGFINFRHTPYSNALKPTNIPGNWINRHLKCLLTGSPDMELIISSINANFTVSGGSFLSVVINGGDSLINQIMARSLGDIVINRVHTYSDGSTIDREFMRAKYDAITVDTGSKSGSTITLTGRATINAISSKSVKIEGVSFSSFSAGVLRYRTSVDDAVSLGDTAIIDGNQIIVGRISYNINPKFETMEISEYLPDGKDFGTVIGNNARPKALTDFQVTSAHQHYNLWKANGFYYNGLVINGRTTGMAFNLYYSQNGLLWYLPGNEGESNITVLLDDNLTQANINS